MILRVITAVTRRGRLIYKNTQADTGRVSQIGHPGDQTEAGPEDFSNHGWSVHYGTKPPKQANET
jgi:hypothetical protein